MLEPAHTARGLARVGPLAGRARVPRSKSLAQRVLVCAALAEGESRILALPVNEDVAALTAALAAAGTRMERTGEAGLLVPGAPPGPRGAWQRGGTIPLGESGTGARLLSAALGLCAEPCTRWRLLPEGSLERRRSPALFRALAATGVGVVHLGPPDAWPVEIASLGPPSDLLLERPGSSQEASALAIALAARPDPIRLRLEGELPSRPYFEMSRAVLARFGARVEEEVLGPATSIVHLQGPLRAPREPLVIEADASAAAVALCAACITDGEVRVEGVGRSSPQGDVRIVEHLSAFGCRARVEESALLAGGLPTRAAELDLRGEPDLAPPLAALAACAARLLGARTLLTGLATLNHKESARVRVLAEGLRRAGLVVESDEQSLAIAPGPHVPPTPLVLDPAGDHRMAFAFALLGLCLPEVRVLDAQCVGKSWPSFFEDLEQLGARIL